MLRIYMGALFALTVLGCGEARAPELSPEVTDAPAAPAEAPREGPDTQTASPDVTSESPAVAPPLSEEDRLRRQIAQLRALLEGELPTDVEPQVLFETDLRNPEAVAARVEALRAELRPPPEETAAEEPVTNGAEGGQADAAVRSSLELDAGQPRDGGPDAGPPLDGGVARGPDAGSDAGVRIDASVILDAAATADGGTVETGGLNPPPPDPPETEPLEALRVERAQLRLQFLSQPTARRDAAVSAARARRALASAQADDAVALRQAESDRARAATDQQHALDRASVASSVAERALLSERARVEEARGRLAQVAGQLAETRSERTRAATEVLDLENSVQEQLARDVSVLPDALYDRVVSALRGARDSLEQGLSELSGDSRVPAFETQVDPDDPSYRDHTVLREQLREANRAYRRAEEQTRQSEETNRWETVENLAERVRSLDLLRITLIDRMSESKRDRILGVGPEGLAQLRREIRQARLMLWCEVERVQRDAPTVPAQLAVWFGASGTRWVLLSSLALMLALILMWRGRVRLTERAGVAVRERQQSARWAALIAPWWGTLGPVFEPLITLAGIYLLGRLTTSLGDSTALTVSLRLALLFAGYRVARTATASLLTSRLRAGENRETLRPRIERDTGLVLGFAAFFWAVLAASELLVGRGYLYSLLFNIAMWMALPVAAVLIFRWAAEASLAFRERYPGGRLAASLAPDAPLRKRVVAVPIAAARLTFDGTVSAIRELALRFEGSRRAVAFLFRRRLEKENRSNKATLDTLPEALKEAFGSRRTELGEGELVPDFASMDVAAEAARSFLAGGRGTGIALVAERGTGKSTWVRQLFETTGLEATERVVPGGIQGRMQTCRWLCGVLDVPPVDDVDALCDSLPEDMRAVVLLEDAHNLILRSVGGTDAARTLVEVVGRTSDRVFWVTTFSLLTWRYFERARQSQELFEHVVLLEGWTDARIANLIRRRVGAQGLQTSFAGLVVGRLEGTAFSNAVIRSEEEFYRLLWDYSNGNPRVALHFFLRSIARIDGQTLVIQLFEAPDPDDLESLHEQSRFILGAVALHENLSVATAAQATTFSRSDVAAVLSLLEARGVLEQDTEGGYRLRTQWYRAAMRYLRRKQLLFA